MFMEKCSNWDLIMLTSSLYSMSIYTKSWDSIVFLFCHLILSFGFSALSNIVWLVCLVNYVCQYYFQENSKNCVNLSQLEVSKNSNKEY